MRVLILTYLFPESLAYRSSSLGCGEDTETGEPQATAHVEIGGDDYESGWLFLVIDWGDDHGVRQSYNLAQIHGTRLDFVHTFENVTDRDDWSYRLLMHADVKLAIQDDLLPYRTEMTCGMTHTPVTLLKSAAPQVWKGIPMFPLLLVVMSV